MIFTEFERPLATLSAVYLRTLKTATLEAWFEEFRRYKVEDLTAAVNVLKFEDRFPTLGQLRATTRRQAALAQHRTEAQLNHFAPPTVDASPFGRLASRNIQRLFAKKQNYRETARRLNRLMKTFKVTPAVPVTGDKETDSETLRAWQSFRRREDLAQLPAVARIHARRGQ